MGLLPKQIELGLQFTTKLMGEDYEIPNYKLAEIQSQIIDWNLCRNNINYDADSELDMALDELYREYEDAESDEQRIDALNDFYIIYTGTLAKSGMKGEELTPELLELYEEYKTIPKRVKSLGYCFRRAMKECLAEINSREQDLTQAKEWAENGASSKWLKRLDQNPDTLYKADYSKALLCKDCDGKEG